MSDNQMTRSKWREQREKARKEKEKQERLDEMNEKASQVKDKVTSTVQETGKKWFKRKKKLRTRSGNMAKERERNRVLNWAIFIVGILLLILLYFVFFV